MKVVALISGGKDSCYAMMKCIQYGHEIVALANLLPVDDSVDELDSYMYQTVGHQIVVSYAKCMGLPLFRRRLQGSTRHHNLNYKMTPGDEVEDMFILLNEIKQQLPSVQAVSSGAIASDYQRLRVESVCSRLGLVSLAYLWKQDQSFLLQEMITNGITAILVKVAAIGLDPQKHLGKELIDLDSHLHHLKDLYGINVCGEGGEYETLTLDCPLFKFARIVMGNFQIILHSPDSIAPVGVLHPLSFHVEAKGDSTASLEYVDSVCEVQGDCLQIHATKTPDMVLDTTIINHHKVQVSKTRRDDIFSICCWLQDPCGAPAGLQDDLRVVLEKIESQLKDAGLGWEHVLYIHLYVADMTQFAAANETYVHFITQEKCWFGVPSRSTIELPLLQVGLGRAYIEVLVAKDETKRVLHVQSISCWAPSCIGPYSQATLHNGILFMAGQLGLDPPTMVLCDGGAATEMEQALAHSEAIAKCFNCSVCSSAIAITIYCSTNIELWERTKVQEKLEMFIKNMEKLHSDGRKVSNVLEPVVLYVLVPNLPKRALVEVKPMLYVAEDWETADEDVAQGISCSDQQGYWGFQYQRWHDDCLRKCVIREKVCAAVVCLTDELMEKLGQHCLLADQNGSIAQDPLVWELMENVAKFCIYRFDRLLREETFSWQDVLYLRIYIHSGFPVSMEKFSLTLTNAFREFTELNPKYKSFPEPLLSLIPVLASGRCAVSMDAAITCELLAQKPCEL